MGIDTTTCRIRIGRFGPGSGYISTGIAEIYSSSITGSDIHYRMVTTMVLFTFLLKCCVVTQQEGIMQYVNTFAGTDQYQLPEYVIVTSFVTLLGSLSEHLIISKPLDGSDSYMV